MSGDIPKKQRERAEAAKRKAAALRANLKRRKQAKRKVAIADKTQPG